MLLLSAEQSRQLDRLSQERYGVPSYALMTRAGEEVARLLMETEPTAAIAASGVMVVAGKGNNGGDGLVCARRLLAEGAKVTALLLGRIAMLKGDAARACADFRAADGSVIEIDDAAALERYFEPAPGAIVDAIFGTGLNAEVAGLPRRAIELINCSAAAVFAVDIASGVNADSGAVMGVAVNATHTVTFGAAKYGHVSYPGAELCGALTIADIGFPPAAMADVAPAGRLLEAAEVSAWLRPRPAQAHKGVYGHPLIIAGGRGKSGAALLASRGALRMGAGLVTTAIPESVADIVAAGQAELMTEPMAESAGNFEASGTIARLRGLLERNTALVVGPGIGVSDQTKALVRFLIAEGVGAERPMLIDADGLNALAELGPELLRQARGAVVLTPHPGEMARLLQSTTAEVNRERISAVHRLCEKTGACCLLKGNRTVIGSPSGVIHINSSGNPGMASPGMGDALSGMVGALLGQGMEPLRALAVGAFVHGAAADRLAASMGPFGFLAGDVIAELPATVAGLLKARRV